MQTLTHLIPELQALLGEQADRLSRSTRFLQRKRCFSGSTFAQTLVLGWLQNPDATLCELANMASALNVQISPQALAQRFTPECADFLKALLLQACQLSVESAFSPEIFSRFSQVFVLDSSVLMLPKVLQEHWLGCGGNQGSNAGLKLHVGIDLCRGQLNLKLSDARSHDLSCELAEMPLPSGSLRLTDLGYFNLDKLSAYNEQGVFWLSRLKVGSIWWNAQGERTELEKVLAQTSEKRLELHGFLGRKKMPVRLFAYRISPEQAAQRLMKLHETSRRRTRPVSHRRLDVVEWTLLVTNAPDLTLDEALALYRVRWQIELLFKLWKQQGKVDEWRSENSWRIICEIYAKLVGLLLQHWLCLGEFWANSRRSLVKAGRVIRRHALAIAYAFSEFDTLLHLLEKLQKSILKGCQVNARRRKPAMWQTLMNIP